MGPAAAARLRTKSPREGPAVPWAAEAATARTASSPPRGKTEDGSSGADPTAHSPLDGPDGPEQRSDRGRRDGRATTLVSLADEVSVNTWLSSFHADGRGIHFMYYAAPPLDRQHYVRFSKSTGGCDINLFPVWRAGDSSIASLDGFFVERPDGILFAVANDRSNRLAVLPSDDGGATWLDYARSEPLEAGFARYAIGGSREIGPSGRILGTYTKQNMGGGLHEVYFFGVDAGRWSAP